MNQFDSISSIYDLIHQDKDYQKESEKIIKLIYENHKNPKKILDVACGSGSHLSFFSKKFECQGIDLCENLIKVAHKKGLKVHKEDMSNFELNEKFDIITCLFGSIAHNLSLKKLEDTLLCFKKHLEKDGIVIIEPWLFEGQFKEQIAKRNVNENINIISKNTIKNKIANLDKTYNVFGKQINSTIKTFCFSKQEYLNSIINSGFKCFHLNINLDFKNGIFLLKC
ncbi:MAG: class I SAM-dependent methyltransferase [Neisseriaceae bacterium]|nr:MAG: class I SAM-dependent methyltransferase [Neisseriaceae bacterium]